MTKRPGSGPEDGARTPAQATGPAQKGSGVEPQRSLNCLQVRGRIVPGQ